MNTKSKLSNIEYKALLDLVKSNKDSKSYTDSTSLTDFKSLKDFKSHISESTIYNHYKFAKNIENIDKEKQKYFCSDKICLLIKKTITKIFKNIKPDNSLVFTLIDLNIIKSNFISSSSKKYSYTYTINPKKKYLKNIKYFLIEKKNPILSIDNNKLVRQKDIIDMVKNFYIIDNKIYKKDIKIVATVNLIYLFDKKKYRVICNIRLNIYSHDPIFIIDIIGIKQE